MKCLHSLAFILLAVWFVITGVVGLAGIAVSPLLAIILNIVALVAGILILITVGKCHCDCASCKEHCKVDVEKHL